MIIHSLDTLTGYLNTPLAHQERGVLLFDLDQTLIQAKPTLGDEHFYQFLMEHNKANGHHPDVHYAWTAKIRAHVPYVACETAEKINQIITSFREKGWTVKILTARGLDMKEATMKHLAQVGINLTPDDVIFKKKPGLKKDDSLIEWMEEQPPCQMFRILFLDDTKKNLADVARVAQKVEKASVTCLHYAGALPNPELSQTQLEQVVVQLHAYLQDQPIPYAYEPERLKIAKDALGIQEITSQALYQKIKELL